MLIFGIRMMEILFLMIDCNKFFEGIFLEFFYRGFLNFEFFFLNKIFLLFWEGVMRVNYYV